jgi:phosphatidylserine decarboxylase
MRIHKEGKLLLIVMLVVFIGINITVFYLFPGSPFLQNVVIVISVILYLLILQFFRDPAVISTTNEKHVLAPADGKVVAIEDTFEPEYFNQQRKQISIFMSPINVHVNRNPVSGSVTYVKYHKGKYLVAWHPKASTDNERTTMVIKTRGGIEILFRQIAGALAKRIKYYIKQGDEVTQGSEFGFIKFGSRVDVFVPIHAKVTVAIGDKTRAGKTLIAELD